MVDDVERLLVRTQRDAVRLFNVMGDLDDGAVCVDPVDGSVFKFPRFVAEVAWIGEVDSPVGVEDQVVRGVQLFTADVVAQDFPLTGR